MDSSELNIETFERNHCIGFRCVFCHKDKWYFADLCMVAWVGNECMIFPFNKKKNEVSSWSEVYCNRSVALTETDLIRCIKEFCNGQA